MKQFRVLILFLYLSSERLILIRFTKLLKSVNSILTMKNSRISLILLVALVYSCSSDNATEDTTTPKKVEYKLIATTSWLTGIWENANEYGAMREIWEVVNDSTIKGTVTATTYGPTVQTEETSITDTLESITLEERRGSIFYIPAVRDQNKGLPVKFRLTSSSDSELKFENPDHDFPQVIHYRKINEDSIFAIVSGIWEGKPVEDKFPFKRAK